MNFRTQTRAMAKLMNSSSIDGKAVIGPLTVASNHGAGIGVQVGWRERRGIVGAWVMLDNDEQRERMARIVSRTLRNVRTCSTYREVAEIARELWPDAEGKRVAAEFEGTRELAPVHLIAAE